MCGSPISGPILIIFFPLGLGIRAYELITNAIHSMDVHIRKNNEKIESLVNTQYKGLKEMILFRKQLISESKLQGKIKSSSSSSLNAKQDSELAHIHVQRAIVRLAAMKYENALEDVSIALHLDESLEETCVWHFVNGLALYHCTNYLESAHAFKKAIELKEAMKENEKSIELEKKILDINLEMKHTHEKVKDHLTEWTEHTKTYFNQFKNMIMKTDTKIQDKSCGEQVPLISLEELHFRAGCSYYYAACFQDGVEHFEKAIEYGKDSPNLKHYIYNKGLCYYYNHDLDEALETFSLAIQLNENVETINMISQTFGRMGELSKKQEYIKKALELDPKTNLLTTAFNYRLLGEDCTELVFSYLPVYTRVMASSTNKYWRELLMKSICTNEKLFEISIENLVSNMFMHNKKVEKRTLMERVFLPAQQKKSSVEFLEDVLQSSFFKYYLELKEKRVIISSNTENYYTSCQVTEKFYPFLTDLVYLNVFWRTWHQVFEKLQELSPNLTEVVIRDDNEGSMDLFSLPQSFASIPKLKTLTITCAITESAVRIGLAEGDGFKFPPSLERIYYNPESCTEFFQVLSRFSNIELIPLEQIYCCHENFNTTY